MLQPIILNAVPRRAGPPPPFAPILDINSAVFAWSIRLLRTAHLPNPVIRLRRDSDNAETDWGVDLATYEIDVAAIDAWGQAAGVASVFFVTHYDQSGNAANATQPVQLLQRLYINPGFGAKPYAAGDGSRFAAAVLAAPVTPNTMHMVARLDVDGGGLWVLGPGFNTHAGFVGTAGIWFYRRSVPNADASYAYNIQDTLGETHQRTSGGQNAVGSTFTDGILQATSLGAVTMPASVDLLIGTWQFPSVGREYEAILQDGDIGGGTIAPNQIAFFGTPF